MDFFPFDSRVSETRKFRYVYLKKILINILASSMCRPKIVTLNFLSQYNEVLYSRESAHRLCYVQLPPLPR